MYTFSDFGRYISVARGFDVASEVEKRYQFLVSNLSDELNISQYKIWVRPDRIAIRLEIEPDELSSIEEISRVVRRIFYGADIRVAEVNSRYLIFIYVPLRDRSFHTLL